MAETIDQLIEEMRTMHARLSKEGGADNASAIAVLDQAVAALGGTANDGDLQPPAADVTTERAPYAIVADAPGTPDNLTQIRGISSATAYALSGLGITRFAHIAGFTSPDVARLHDDLGYRCTIHRDGWIEQAAILAAGGSTSFSRRGAPMENAARPAPTDAVPEAAAPIEPANTDMTSAGLNPTKVMAAAVIANGSDTSPEATPVDDIAGPIAADPPHKSLENADDTVGEAELPIAQPLNEIESGQPSWEMVVENTVSDDPLIDEDIPISSDAPAESLDTADGTTVEPSDSDASDAVSAEPTSPSDVQVGSQDVVNEISDSPPVDTVSEAGDSEAQSVVQRSDDLQEQIHLEAEPTGSYDDVFATLPEPVAIVPLQGENGSFIDDRGELSDLLVDDAAPEPLIETASPIEAIIDTSASASEFEMPEQSVGDEIESAEAEVKIDAPLTYAPGEPTFAPAFNASNASSHDAGDIEIKITEYEDDDPQSSGEDEAVNESEQRGFLDRVRAASGVVSPNGATHGQPNTEQDPGSPATIDPLHEPFSRHKTAVDEAEVVIVRDGEPEPLHVEIPPIEPRDTGLTGKLARMFRRKS